MIFFCQPKPIKKKCNDNNNEKNTAFPFLKKICSVTYVDADTVGKYVFVLMASSFNRRLSELVEAVALHFSVLLETEETQTNRRKLNARIHRGCFNTLLNISTRFICLLHTTTSDVREGRIALMFLLKIYTSSVKSLLPNRFVINKSDLAMTNWHCKSEQATVNTWRLLAITTKIR